MEKTPFNKHNLLGKYATPPIFIIHNYENFSIIGQLLKTQGIVFRSSLYFPHTFQGLFFTRVHGREQADNHRQNECASGDDI